MHLIYLDESGNTHAWLSAQNKRSGEDPGGVGSSSDGRSRR